MECLLLGSQMMRNEQLVVEDHLIRRRRRHRGGGDVFDYCTSSSPIYEEEEDEEVESSTPLQDMSSLLLQLPLKRGLSTHYNGKSQSFKSLSNVKSLEDLAKQENPFNKKLKSCTRKEPSIVGSNFSSSISGGRNSNFLGN